jgi:hypothetical protein
MRDNPKCPSLVFATQCLYWKYKEARQETAMPHLQLQAHDLLFLIPMALVGLLAMNAIPVAAKALRISCRCAGAIIGVLLGVLVLEALPLLI